MVWRNTPLRVRWASIPAGAALGGELLRAHTQPDGQDDGGGLGVGVVLAGDRRVGGGKLSRESACWISGSIGWLTGPSRSGLVQGPIPIWKSTSIAALTGCAPHTFRFTDHSFRVGKPLSEGTRGLIDGE